MTNPDKVHYLTWGNETATNEFSRVPNVILAGTLFYPKSVYEVRARASKGMRSEVDLDLAAFKELEMGEHRNLILQAACRGAVRRCIGDQGDAMDLYLIAAKRTGIPHLLREVFPGAKLKGWSPTDKPLKGKVKDAIDYIRRHIKSLAHRYEPLPFVEVQRAIGMKHRQNFNQDIRKHPEFRQALVKIQVRVVSLNHSKRLTHFQFP